MDPPGGGYPTKNTPDNSQGAVLRWIMKSETDGKIEQGIIFLTRILEKFLST